MKTLERKNIMIESNKWKILKMLSETDNNRSISKIVSEAVDKYINEEINNNLAFKLKMIAMDKYISQEEENEIVNDLESMSIDDLKPDGKLNI